MNDTREKTSIKRDKQSKTAFSPHNDPFVDSLDK